MVTPDSNIIIVRGGNRPVYEQLLAAAETYFPESNILDDVKVDVNDKAASGDKSQSIPLRRVNTNVSSIVGPDNGERDGGFILVIDGAALTQVEVKPFFVKLELTERTGTF